LRSWDDERKAAFLAGPVMWGSLVFLVLFLVGVTLSYLDIDISVGPRTEELAIADPAHTDGVAARVEQTAEADDSGAGGGALGSSVFAANCATCHGASGEGGVGPPLAGRSIGRSEIAAIVGSGRGVMPSFSATLSAEEVSAVVDYVVALGAGSAGQGVGEETVSEDPDADPDGSGGGGVSGSSVFGSNCAGCHGASGQGGVGPPLAGRSIGRGEIAAIVGSGRGLMPSFSARLSAEEVSAVVDYVAGLGSGTVADPATPQPTQPPPSTSGGTFGLFCAGCHGADGRGTELGRDLRGREDKVFDAVRFGEDEMPAFPPDAITDAQLGEIVAYVRSIKNGS
jgi:ubiquinol-cytochrome c reductase cytochrome c subunit